MKKFLLVIFFLYSCQENFESKYDKALALSENNSYRESNVILYKIIESPNSSEDMKNKSHFLLADIYLKINQYENAISSYKKILNAPIDDRLRKQSVFMIGYIYFNNLNMYTHAKKYYEQFKSEYENDDLTASVNYEIKSIDEIINNAK